MVKSSKYAKASAEAPSARMNFPRPTHALIRIDSVREQKTRGGEGITAELTVLKVLSTPQATDYETGAPYAPHTPGEAMHDRMLDTNVGQDRWIKTLVLTASGLTDEEFQEAEEYPGQAIEQALSEDQPLAGAVIEMRAVPVIKEKAQNKAEEDLGKGDAYVRSDFLRVIRFADVASLFDEDEVARFFPNLDELVAEEAAD